MTNNLSQDDIQRIDNISSSLVILEDMIALQYQHESRSPEWKARIADRWPHSFDLNKSHLRPPNLSEYLQLVENNESPFKGLRAWLTDNVGPGNFEYASDTVGLRDLNDAFWFKVRWM